MKKLLHDAVALISGLLFGTGLLISDMVDPDKVKGFLDVTGRWDPSLGLVMGGAIAVALPAFQWLRRRQSAVKVNDALEREPTRIDGTLVVGSLVFGIGWGLSGYCPGPALVAASSGSGLALWYVVAMAVGSWLGMLLQRPRP